MSPEVAAVFWTVVAVRFLLPLLIPRFPLPAIVACLVVDGIDQSVFQAFGFDPPGYQGYDKAMDVYYLAVAYLTTMRNWTSSGAAGVARFLFFYRMVGVVAFELTGWRALLLVFPNTFEYFFIAYEAVRSRWDPRRLSPRQWVVVAGVIWVVVKLPQEYWIHIAQLDFTDTWQDVPWFAPLVVLASVAALAVLWFVVRPRLAVPDWRLQLAADPLPEVMDTAAERDAWTAVNGRVWSWGTLEKVVLVGLLCVIYGSVIPGVEETPLQLLAFTAFYVVVSTAASLTLARRVGSAEGAGAAFLVRLVLLTAVVVGIRLVAGPAVLPFGDAMFFITLLALLTTLHDRYAPIGAVRRDLDATAPRPPPPSPRERG